MSGLRAAGVAVAGMVVVVAGAGVAGLLGGGGVTAGATATATIPAVMLRLYVRAAATCPGLPWTVLAGIGTVESGNGTYALPGVHSGTSQAGAEGPMQFEPATFAAYGAPPAAPFAHRSRAAAYTASGRRPGDGGRRPPRRCRRPGRGVPRHARRPWGSDIYLGATRPSR